MQFKQTVFPLTLLCLEVIFSWRSWTCGLGSSSQHLWGGGEEGSVLVCFFFLRPQYQYFSHKGIDP